MLYSELRNIAARISAAPAAKPMSRRVGVEIETNNNRRASADALRVAGLAAPSRSGACDYHCSDYTCHDYPVHPQSDCSISGVEAIVGGAEGMDVSSERLHNVIEQTCRILDNECATVNASCGAHVHVDRDDLDFDGASLLIRNTHQVRDELQLLMSAARRDGIRHRGYDNESTSLIDWQNNFCFCSSCYEDGGEYGEGELGERGYWFWFTSYGTVEFRGWNATISAWRHVMATHVSAALVQAAVDGKLAVSGRILDHIGEYLPYYVQLLVQRQFAYLARETFRVHSYEVPGTSAA